MFYSKGCNLNTCQNGGLCYLNSIGQAACMCPSGTSGTYCQYSLTTTTTKSSPFTCTDYNSTMCQLYSSKGYCSLNVYINGALISVSCAASCNPSCKTNMPLTTTTRSCTDYNSTLCQTYASKGYCSLNVYVNGFPIKVSCGVSCNACS